jgi:hypothetical protein
VGFSGQTAGGSNEGGFIMDIQNIFNRAAKNTSLEDFILVSLSKDKKRVYTMSRLSEQLANKLVDRMVANPKSKIQLHKIALFLEKVCENELYREAL